MKVLIDTSIWSHVLRRKYRPENAATVGEFASLVADGRVAIIGAMDGDFDHFARFLPITIYDS
jgi:hypothetical protein